MNVILKGTLSLGQEEAPRSLGFGQAPYYCKMGLPTSPKVSDPAEDETKKSGLAWPERPANSPGQKRPHADRQGCPPFAGMKPPSGNSQHDQSARSSVQYIPHKREIEGGRSGMGRGGSRQRGRITYLCMKLTQVHPSSLL